jgi:hypothetical protein
MVKMSERESCPCATVGSAEIILNRSACAKNTRSTLKWKTIPKNISGQERRLKPQKTKKQ